MKPFYPITIILLLDMDPLPAYFYVKAFKYADKPDEDCGPIFRDRYFCQFLEVLLLV